MNEIQAALLILALLYLLMGSAMAFSVKKIRKGKTKVNGWVGIRTPATLQSQQAWDAGHRSALPQFKLGSVVLIAAAFVLLALAGLDVPEWLGVTVALTVIVFTVGNLIYAAVTASAAARRVSQTG